MVNIEEYSQEHPHYWAEYFYNPQLETILVNNTFSRMLDVGCGDGALLYTMERKGMLAKFKEVWATDLSHTRLMSVKKISSSIRTIQDDAQTLSSLPENYFDLVISTQVIEHVQDDQKMLRALSRICCDGAILFIDTIIKKPYARYFNTNAHGESVLDETHEREYKSEGDLFDGIDHAELAVINSLSTPLRFPLIDFFVRRMNLNDPRLYEQNRLLRLVRRIKIPIPGYSNWSITLMKKTRNG
jgi:SAM-dependent methyltransferase